MLPKISVLIPLYNVENYISRCLDSILCQTFQNFEIVVVDDASTDNSLSIVKEYQQKDNRIKIIEKKSNEGLMMARKTGYENATGEYYFFCDSDDYIPSDSLSNLYNSMISDEKDMIVGDMLIEFDTGGNRYIKRSSKANSPNQYKIAILNGITCSLCGILYKSSLFKNANYITFKHQNFSEDRILINQILEKTVSIGSANCVTYIYYINKSSMTRQRLSDEKIFEQFNALSWSFRWNEKYDNFRHDNTRWFLRFISFYIESGYNMKKIIGDDDFYGSIINFKNYVKYCGIRIAIHTYLCVYLPFYQKLSSYSRIKIRHLIATFHKR